MNKWLSIVAVVSVLLMVMGCQKKHQDNTTVQTEPDSVAQESERVDGFEPCLGNTTDSTDSKPNETGIEHANNAQNAVNALADLPQAPLDSDKAAKLSDLIDNKREEKHIPGLAVGIIKNGAVVYSHCSGTTKMDDGEPITPETMFNIQPEAILDVWAAFDRENENLNITADELKKAGVQAYEVLPKGEYALPHGNMANEEPMAIDPKYLEKQEMLWSNQNGMMHYLANVQNLEKLLPDRLFRDEYYTDLMLRYKLKCNGKKRNGYTFSICEFPEKQLRFLLLANSSAVDEEYFVAAMLSAVTDSEYMGLADKVLEYDEILHGGSMRSMETTIEAGQEYDYLLGTYHDDMLYGDLQIIKDEKNVVVQSDKWRSRLGILSVYDSSMTQEVDAKEADKIRKTHPEYILAEMDTGALVNETIYTSMVLFDPPVTGNTVTVKMDDKSKKDSKANVIVIDDVVQFNRVE